MNAPTMSVPQLLTPQQADVYTDTRDLLAHAKRDAIRRKYHDWFICDIDAHHVETVSWKEIITYIEDPVVREQAIHFQNDRINAPPYGLASYPIDAGNEWRRHPHQPVVVERGAMRNGAMRVAVDKRGIVSLEHFASGRRIASLLELIDETDLGDLYTPSPRLRDATVQFRGARRVHRGPLRGELALRYRIVGPASVRRPDVKITIHLILDADAPFLRVEVRGTNRAKNHRVRLAFASNTGGTQVWADAAFGPVRRDPIVVDDRDMVSEKPPPTAPLHRYVSIFDTSFGFTVYSDGLGEYEAREDAALVVTLVRAVGELSRNDLPERPGHAGWPTPTPGAQSLGPFEAAFGVMLHGPHLPAVVDEIERVADDVLLPLKGETLRSALRGPEMISGVELIGTGLAFSTFKESEDGDWLVLRCFNLRDDEVAGSWRLPFEIREVRLARLDETPMSALIFKGGEVRFKAAPRAQVTILVR